MYDICTLYILYSVMRNAVLRTAIGELKSKIKNFTAENKITIIIIAVSDNHNLR